MPVLHVFLGRLLVVGHKSTDWAQAHWCGCAVDVPLELCGRKCHFDDVWDHDEVVMFRLMCLLHVIVAGRAGGASGVAIWNAT